MNYTKVEHSISIKNKAKFRKKKKLKNKLKYALIFMAISSVIFFSFIFNQNRVNENLKTNNLEIPKEIINSQDPVIKNLIKSSSKYPNTLTILNDINSYPQELIELASKKPETIDFVSNFKEHLSTATKSKISVKSDYQEGKIPLFLQWDERWGYDKYGDNFIAINGCGPTTLSMVIVGLTKDTSINPKVVADFSAKKGYLVNNVGSSWDLMSKGAKAFGLKSSEVPLSKSSILSTLKKGHPIIASMGPGQFTTSGHYIVLTGVTDDEKIIVNDPDSKSRSNKTWDIDVFMKESKNLWKFSK